MPEAASKLAQTALLAQGFAARLEHWSRTGGAKPASARAAAHAARHLSLQCSQGDVCVSLSRIPADRDWPEDVAASRSLLIASGVVGNADADPALPLVLDADDRLYLHRYFDYERRLARRLQMVREPVALSLEQIQTVRDTLCTLLPEPEADSVVASQALNWQRIAVAMGVAGRVTVVSGGPGTGKTTMVVKLLACLLALDPDSRIALAAPTGKAAARMIDAIRQSAQSLPAQIRDRLPAQATTIHRLLGVQADNNRFRHRIDNPLPVDLVVVDEASMLDLSLAVHLFEAVPTHARLMLLGDKDQLAAVESGAVFADLSCNPEMSASMREQVGALAAINPQLIQPAAGIQSFGLSDLAVWFTRSYRFAHDSPIGRLAASINRTDSDDAIRILRTEPNDRLHWIDDSGTADADLLAQARVGYRAYFDALSAKAPSPEAVFGAFAQFRVLCAVHDGRRGVDSINEALRDSLCQMRGSVRADGSDWFFGRPVMVLQNDHALRLFNGDIGILLPGPSGQPMVFFEQPAGGFRMIPPVRLPAVQTAFALTVHKAQGSEFDAVMLLLPQQPHRVVSRELLYTAVTRARQRVVIVGAEPVVRAAIGARTERQSGLLQRLRETS